MSSGQWAEPATGYHFVRWEGDLSGTDNPKAFEVTSDVSATAVFALNEYTLTLTSTGSGSVAKDPDQATYTHGTVVSLTATPLAGGTFSRWEGSVTADTFVVHLWIDKGVRAKCVFETAKSKIKL